MGTFSFLKRLYKYGKKATTTTVDVLTSEAKKVDIADAKTAAKTSLIVGGAAGTMAGVAITNPQLDTDGDGDADESLLSYFLMLPEKLSNNVLPNVAPVLIGAAILIVAWKVIK